MNRKLLLYGLMSALVSAIKSTVSASNNTSANNTILDLSTDNGLDHSNKYLDLETKYDAQKLMFPEGKAETCDVLSVIQDASNSVDENVEWQSYLNTIAKTVNDISPGMIDVIEFSNYARGVIPPQEFTDSLLEAIKNSPYIGGGSQLSPALTKLLADLPTMLKDPELENTLLIISDFKINTADRFAAVTNMKQILDRYPGIKTWCAAINADLDFAKSICGDKVISFESYKDFGENWNRISKNACDNSTPTPTAGTDKPTNMPIKTEKPTKKPTTHKPTHKPTVPTQKPTHPTKNPTTEHPSQAPSKIPTGSPTIADTPDNNALYACISLLLLLIPSARSKKLNLAAQNTSDTQQPLLSSDTQENVDTQEAQININTEAQTSNAQVETNMVREIYSSFLLVTIYAVLWDRKQLKAEVNITPIIDTMRAYFGYEKLGPGTSQQIGAISASANAGASASNNLLSAYSSTSSTGNSVIPTTDLEEASDQDVEQQSQSPKP